MERIRERLTGDVRNSVPLLTSALESELDTQMFILRNVAKQINREGGFLQRLIPALRRDSEVCVTPVSIRKPSNKIYRGNSAPAPWLGDLRLFAEFPWPFGCHFSYILPQQDGATYQILDHPTRVHEGNCHGVMEGMSLALISVGLVPLRPHRRLPLPARRDAVRGPLSQRHCRRRRHARRDRGTRNGNHPTGSNSNLGI